MAQERACLPGTNCLVIVPQDRYVAVENCGKFYAAVQPGLHFAGIDCCGLCVHYRSISSRVHQIPSTVSAKTKDAVFMDISVAVQYVVHREDTVSALYKLSDSVAQIESFVADAVRSCVPRLTLDECFEKSDIVLLEIHQRLNKEMAEYGFTIVQTMITEIAPCAEVAQAVNEINRQKRLRDAAIHAAEAKKATVILAAEGAAEASFQQGNGIARQRNAIADGYKDIFGGGSQVMPADHLSDLLLATQYFQTLREVSQAGGDLLVYLRHGPAVVGEAAEQLNALGAPAPAPHPHRRPVESSPLHPSPSSPSPSPHAASTDAADSLGIGSLGALSVDESDEASAPIPPILATDIDAGLQALETACSIGMPPPQQGME